MTAAGESVSGPGFDVIDCRCRRTECSTQMAYRMRGRCTNCGASPLTGLFTVGHEARNIRGRRAQCPACLCYTVWWSKLAGLDTEPVA